MEVLVEDFEEKTPKANNFEDSGPKYSSAIKPKFNKVQKNSVSELHQKLKVKNRKLQPVQKLLDRNAPTRNIPNQIISPTTSIDDFSPFTSS